MWLRGKPVHSTFVAPVLPVVAAAVAPPAVVPLKPCLVREAVTITLGPHHDLQRKSHPRRVRSYEQRSFAMS